jgi:hypothetical protein
MYMSFSDPVNLIFAIDLGEHLITPSHAVDLLQRRTFNAGNAAENMTIILVGNGDDTNTVTLKVQPIFMASPSHTLMPITNRAQEARRTRSISGVRINAARGSARLELGDTSAACGVHKPQFHRFESGIPRSI